MKKLISVQSPANIAFIKYWGQQNAEEVLPYNDSFSMNLSACITTIEMEVLDDSSVQEMEIKQYDREAYVQASSAQLDKVISYYQVAKKYLEAEIDFGFIIRSSNTFPMKAGIASSASFFSALALAFATAFGKKLPKHELSVLARLSGSGSACRSIDNGYVWWNKDSYAESIAPPEFWNLVDLVLIINPEEKQTGSQDGHKGAITSPYFQSRIKDLAIICDDVKDAFQKKDFTLFGCLVEKEALNFCSILMTQTPPLLYWTDKTVLAMKEVYAMREQGTEVYFTIDAGANLHVICEKKDEEKVKEHFEKQLYVQKIISNYPCQGTRLI